MLKRKLKPLKERKLHKKYWIHKCDELWSKIIRLRDRQCLLRGKDRIRCGGVLQGMHIKTRGNWGIRYDLENGIGGCQGHHTYYTYHDAEWNKLVEKLMPGRLDLLEERQQKYSQRTFTDYIELHTYLSDTLNKLE